MPTGRPLGALLALLAGACAAGPPSAPPEPRAVSVPVRPSAEPEPPAPASAQASPGTRELLAELEVAVKSADPLVRWQETRRLFEAVRTLADPRGADALAKWVADARGWPGDPERVYRRTQAAFALAELGDLRALPALAARLELDPLELYREEDPNQVELRRSDQERVVAARLIGDLAALHPQAQRQLRDEARDAVLRWLDSGPQPHSNGMRALARMQVDDPASRKKLLDWADPPGALPKPAAPPPFEEKWAVAQSALRYVGALRDDAAWPVLQKQLARKPKNLDVTTDALVGGGHALLGMTLRALALGAASGFAEWGDPRAVPLLVAHVEDAKQNETSRREACRALAYTLDAKQEKEILSRLAKWKDRKDPVSEERVRCLLEVLRQRPIPAATPALLAMTAAGSRFGVPAARALGYAGLDAAAEQELLDRLPNAEARAAAALALLLGGSADAARRVGAAFGSDAELLGFQDDYLQSVDAPVEADLDAGRLFRFVRNARALAGVLRAGAPLELGVRVLRSRLSQGDYDSGPRSLPRVILRKRLYDAARSGPAERRAAAVDTLELLGERGVLLALGVGPGALAEHAAGAAPAARPEPPPR